MAKIDRVQEVSTDLLRPYENNAKIHGQRQIEALKESILEFGFISPCLIDKDFNIIVGHGRVEAAKELNMQTVPCVFIEGLSEAQRKAYILVDNKLTEMGEWDFDIVNQELESLDNMDFDVSVTGFEFLDSHEPKEIVEDEITDEVEPRTKKGDIWQLGNHKLMCGDSTSEDDILKLTQDSSVDLVFTDAPYGINIVNDKGNIGHGNLAKVRKYSNVIADDSTETAERAYNII